MEITCERYEKRHLGAVRRFNQRMRERGVDPAYLLPTEVQDDPPGDPAPPIWSEYILAVESDTINGSEVRGAYLAQWRKFLVMGEERRLGNYQTPISEGIIDRKYTSVGIASLKFAMRSNPYWYTVGMGGLDRPLPKILRSFGWNLVLVPRAQRESIPQGNPAFANYCRAPRRVGRIALLRRRMAGPESIGRNRRCAPANSKIGNTRSGPLR